MANKKMLPMMPNSVPQPLMPVPKPPAAPPATMGMPAEHQARFNKGLKGGFHPVNGPRVGR